MTRRRTHPGHRRPLLAATLIVKDEAAMLPGCLASLDGIVDEICIYDTGSTDDTVAIARAAGARVIEGYWDGDFARARNEALAMSRAEWALIIDADERLDGVDDALLLRRHLLRAGPVEVVTMTVVNLAPGEGHEDDRVLVEAQALLSHRIARRSAVHWQGRVHEKLVSAAAARGLARPLREARLEGARIVHHGYVDADRRQAKAERNLAIAQARLDELVGLGSQDVQAATTVLLDLGRTYLGLGRQQAAVDSFEALREIAADGPERAAATVLLAQLLADARGFDDVVLHLVGELRADGITRPQLCDWLEAQVEARVPSHQEHALELMSGITELVDPAGNHRSLGPVLQTRALLAGSLGHIDRAGADLLDAVADHGTGLDQLPLLLQLYASRRTELAVTLARKLLAGAPAAEATVAGLQRLGGGGAQVAATVIQLIAEASADARADERAAGPDDATAPNERTRPGDRDGQSLPTATGR